MEDNFEINMEKLEKVVAELENENLSLDESVKKFEEGIELSKKCNEILQKAEKRITILLENAENYEEKDFKIENN
ncbi:MAG: exodeoxyribonuclease VII small subunit [Clostridia bacterium]|nr:exodeoxyribonuclease VII small subunit [Clostridia bacterium]